MTAPTTYCNECGASNPLQATCCFACNTALQPPAPSPLLPVHTANAAMLVRGARNGLLPSSYLLHSRYSIVRQIGTGGFGAVYQAQDTLFSHRRDGAAMARNINVHVSSSMYCQACGAANSPAVGTRFIASVCFACGESLSTATGGTGATTNPLTGNTEKV